MTVKDFPKLDEKDEQQIIFDLTQYGLAHGLVMYPQPFENYQANLAPVTLFPTPFPKSQFDKAVRLSKTYNALYAAIVAEKKWLLRIVEELAPFDADFTGRLYESYLKAKKAGIVQPVSLGLIRSDFMYDTVTEEIKQVEFNTVSVSFAGLSSKVSQLHKFLNDQGLYGGKYYEDSEIPVSEASQGLALGLKEAVEYYESKHTDSKTIVLFVVQPKERNAFDQRAIEYSLFEHGIASKRVDLPKVTSLVEIDPKTKKLYYEKQEVSVVYYRSAYGPAEFAEETAWDCRVQLESTLAIKCPSLTVQLSGAKKIQQLLTEPTVIGKFVPDSDPSKSELLSTFCRIYPLDDSEESVTAKKLAFERPERFVLKPQREGGGNNVYKEDIPVFLKSIPEKEWSGYILMELIHPPTEKNVLLRDGKLITDGVVSELGIFGAYLLNEDTGDLLHNSYSGYLLRSKISTSNEGGVAAGYGCVDSLYLY